MQDKNDLQEILNAKLGAFDDLVKEPMPANATSRTISRWPKKGEVVKLRGLDFQVRFANERTGELRLALVRAAQLPREPETGHSLADEVASIADELPKHSNEKA